MRRTAPHPPSQVHARGDSKTTCGPIFTDRAYNRIRVLVRHRAPTRACTHHAPSRRPHPPQATWRLERKELPAVPDPQRAHTPPLSLSPPTPLPSRRRRRTLDADPTTTTTTKTTTMTRTCCVETRASLCVARVEERGHLKKKTLPHAGRLSRYLLSTRHLVCPTVPRVREPMCACILATRVWVQSQRFFFVLLTTYITIYPLMHQSRARIWKNYLHADMRYVRSRITSEIDSSKKKWLTPISS